MATKQKDYDIFISYRRTASESAQLIASSLRGAGYDVFLDVESLRSGKFNEQLFDVIDSCKDFLVVLPEGALERCSDPEDWVRKEVCRALDGQKNIIPIMLSGFSWPEAMPDGMEALKDYQGISASAGEYFDLAMQKLQRYLKSRSHKSRKRGLTIVAAAIVSILVLAFAGIELTQVLSLPFYRKVSDILCEQTSVLSLMGDVSEDLETSWTRFFSSYSSAPGERSRKEAVGVLLQDLQNADKDVNTFQAQLDDCTMEFTEFQAILLGLRDIGVEDILQSHQYCATFIEDLRDRYDFIKDCVEDGEVSLTENEAVKDHAEVFRLSSNMFFYSTLEVLSHMPSKALDSYHRLVTQWRHFPNGTGLSHTSKEYQQYCDAESNKLRDIISRMEARGLKEEQKLLDMMADLTSIVTKYNSLYTEVLQKAQIDTTKTPEENWNGVILLSSFLMDALVNAGDIDGSDMMIAPEQVLQDITSVLKNYASAYPLLSLATVSAEAYYTALTQGKDLKTGLVVALSMTPKVQMGDLVVSLNEKAATPKNYQTVSEIISAGDIRSLKLLRGNEIIKVTLSADENAILFFPLMMDDSL